MYVQQYIIYLNSNWEGSPQIHLFTTSLLQRHLDQFHYHYLPSSLIWINPRKRLKNAYYYTVTTHFPRFSNTVHVSKRKLFFVFIRFRVDKVA